MVRHYFLDIGRHVRPSVYLHVISMISWCSSQQRGISGRVCSSA